MKEEDFNEDLLDPKDLRMFALGNTILFFACVVYPFGEGLFSVLYIFELLGNKSEWNCLVNKDDRDPIQYDAVGKDYQNLMLFQTVTDVSKKFKAANVFTLICMITIQASFVLNYYYNHLIKFAHLRNKMFYITVGINSLLFLTVLV